MCLFLPFCFRRPAGYNHCSVASWQLQWLHLHPQHLGKMANYRGKELVEKYIKLFFSLLLAFIPISYCK